MHDENLLIPSLEPTVVAEESRTLSSLLGGLDSPGGVPRDVMKLYLEPAGTLGLPTVPPSSERGGPDQLAENCSRAPCKRHPPLQISGMRDLSFHAVLIHPRRIFREKLPPPLAVEEQIIEGEAQGGETRA